MTNSSNQILQSMLLSPDDFTRGKAQDTQILLQHVQEKLCEQGQIEVLMSHYVIFMMMKIFGTIPNDVIRHLEAQHGEVILKALRTTFDGPESNLNTVETLQPNMLSENEISLISKAKESRLDSRQSPLGFLWMQQIDEQNEGNHALAGLMSNYSIICLNDDKEVIKFEDIEAETIGEMLWEVSPYLILVPKQQNVIMMSASSLHPSLNFLKDLKKLLKVQNPYADKIKSLSLEDFGKRMTQVKPLTKMSTDQFSRSLNLFNLEKSYELKKTIEVSTIDRILCDEDKHLNLRDLPSFYTCATELLSQMRQQLNNGNQQDKLLDEARHYGNDAINEGKIDQDDICNLRENLVNQSSQNQRQLGVIDTLIGCFLKFISLDTLVIIEQMLVLPLEHARLVSTAELEYTDSYIGELKFWLYHSRDIEASCERSQPHKETFERLNQKINHISKLMPSQKEHQKLQDLLQFASRLDNTIRQLVSDLSSQRDLQINLIPLLNKTELVNQLLIKGFDIFYPQFNHIIEPLMTSSLHIIVCVRVFFYDMIKEEAKLCRLAPISTINAQENYQYEATIISKKAKNNGTESMTLFENHLLWLLKLQRLNSSSKNDKEAYSTLKVYALDHFVRREIAKKIADEAELDDQEAQVMQKVPFKMKVQGIMEMTKTIDELTAKDKEKMQKEADEEIELNFPSYFDEFQKQLYSLTRDQPLNREDRDFYQGKHLEVIHREVAFERIFGELTEVNKWDEDCYKTEFLRLRLEIVQMSHEETQVAFIPRGKQYVKVPELLKSFSERDNEWMEDAICCLEDQIKLASMKSVMNIADLVLPSTYNFYHDTIPQEARLIFQPLAQLQARVRDILTEYESPILVDVIFLANYMMTTLNTKTSPLMKMLTGMELLLEKLDEWQSYASKKLNSCHEEINSLKMLIIRYRKIQILSWRNLLNHKRVKMIREDFPNCLRMIHTVERQIFDVQLYRDTKRAANSSKNLQQSIVNHVELEVFELIDLFVRDSSLGLYESRLKIINLLYESLKFKQDILNSSDNLQYSELIQMQKYTPLQKSLVKKRLEKVLNILHFILGYYGQFHGKLQRTIGRLDLQARDKIKTLIDVSKWTVQKFTQVKSNIDKTHRQLNKACRQEEEILMQNIQSLVLTSSRKKYINTDAGGDKLISLDNEKKDLLSNEVIVIQQTLTKSDISQSTLLRQLDFFESKQIKAKWPDANSLEQVMTGLFDRLKTVRDLDKKHFQRRAYMDMLKFMKDQGLRPNFQDKLQPWIIKSKLTNTGNQQLQTRLDKYFYKAQELMMIMENASQADENSDLKNADVIRIQGFSKSLMQRILQINEQLSKLENLQQQFKPENLKTYVEQGETSICITPQACVEFSELVDDLKKVEDNTIERLNIIKLLESKLPNKNDQIEQVKGLSDIELNKLKDRAHAFMTLMDKTMEENLQSRRIKRIALEGKDQASSVIQRIEGLSQKVHQSVDNPNQENSAVVSKRTRLLQKYVQLLYQNIFKHVKDFQDDDNQGQVLKKDEAARKESFDHSTVLSNSDQTMAVANQGAPQAQEEQFGDLNITEQLQFTKKLNEQLESSGGQKDLKTLEEITSLIKKIVQMEGLPSETQLSDEDVNSIIQTKALSQKVQSLLSFIHQTQATYLASLCKFSYITQRIFVYLIYQGFCGQEDQNNDDNQQEDDNQFDMEGCGMGDGKGNKNVSNEIEHEEQLEGLKNYESEEEQEQQEQDNQDDKDDQNSEEENNDFEMQEDFDGELEDEKRDQPEEDKEEDENREDDQLDQVDDMLDNELWNQNMEDMEQKEDEHGENEDQEEPEEIDLGERQLDEQNQLQQQEPELAEGDHDQQREQEPRQEQEQQEQEQQPEDPEVVRDDEEQQDDEMSNGEESAEEIDPNEIPLNRDELVEEDQDGRRSEEASEEAPDDQQMEDAESHTEEEQENLSLDPPEDENEQNIDDGFQERDNQDDPEQQQDDEAPEDVDQQGENREQDVLDDDQGENSSQEDHDQDNLRQGERNYNEQEQTQQQNQQQNQNQELQTEFDSNGNDILYQLAQKIEEQQKKKEERRQEKAKQEKLDLEKRQVEDAKMTEEEKKDKAPKPDDQQEGEGMEYEFDEEAGEMQGRLATDNLQQDEEMEQLHAEEEEKKGNGLEEDQADDRAPEEDEQNSDMVDEEIQQTQQPVTANEAKTTDPKKKKNKNDDDAQIQEDEQPIPEADLVEDYENYLEQMKREQSMAQDAQEQMDVDQEQQVPQDAICLPDYAVFDYFQEKLVLRAFYEHWRTNPEESQKAIALLSKFKSQTNAASASLCEQLRIVLEPQLSQQLQGDYRTGKRLNMKKVISFIASNYRNDKIWLRRTMPSKRDYKILVAIDDSLSMREQNTGFFSLEAMVTLVEALNRLEAGKVAVARIRDRLDLLQSFEDQYSNERTAFIVSQFEFQHCAKQSHDHAMANFVKDANKLLDFQNTQSQSHGATSCPIVIILSDGRFNKNNVRKYMQEAQEKKYLYIFVVLDAPKPSASGTPAKDQAGILSLKSAVKKENTPGIKITPYLQDFPFNYYCIVRDLQGLPSALSSILVQWFSIMQGSN